MAEYIEIPGHPTIQQVDLVCGGFPCQDVSCAGKREGLAGPRSGLWFEMVKTIRYLRPKYVIVENVPGLLSCGFGRVLGDLAASGYDAEWDCLPAVAFGAPHLRYRVFVVAYPSQQKENSADRDSCRKHLDRCSHPLSDAHGTGLQITRNAGTIEESETRIFAGATINRSGWWSTEPDVGRVAHGVPGRVDRLKALGNAVIPEEITWIAERIKLREATESLRQDC